MAPGRRLPAELLLPGAQFQFKFIFAYLKLIRTLWLQVSSSFAVTVQLIKFYGTCNALSQASKHCATGGVTALNGANLLLIKRRSDPLEGSIPLGDRIFTIILAVSFPCLRSIALRRYFSGCKATSWFHSDRSLNINPSVHQSLCCLTQHHDINWQLWINHHSPTSASSTSIRPTPVPNIILFSFKRDPKSTRHSPKSLLRDRTFICYLLFARDPTYVLTTSYLCTYDTRGPTLRRGPALLCKISYF